MMNKTFIGCKDAKESKKLKVVLRSLKKNLKLSARLEPRLKDRDLTLPEIEQLGERLDEAGGAHVQVELNKKREAEVAKLRKD